MEVQMALHEAHNAEVSSWSAVRCSPFAIWLTLISTFSRAERAEASARMAAITKSLERKTFVLSERISRVSRIRLLSFIVCNGTLIAVANVLSQSEIRLGSFVSNFQVFFFVL